MGCGLSKTYPPENAELFEQIVAGDRGALVSELPMAVGVQSKNFPLRNRIISGLSLDELVRETRLDASAVISTLTMLAIRGIVAQRPGSVFALKRAR